ncbi:MAG: hypothetical protein GDA67_13865 [Nitrospira sp. CR1.3]|nr:hypothetical protein [Nitrospira sp. CR1.3]
MRSGLLLIVLGLVAACSSSKGLPVETLQEILRQEAIRFEGERSPKPSPSHNFPPTPPALGLYLKPTGFLQHEFEWSNADRDHVLTWARRLTADHGLASANFVPQSSLKGDQLVQLRDSAARYGADFLLVFDGAAAVDRYNNYKGPLLYWTIIGAYVADGTHSDALCLIRGSLWEVKTGSLLFQEEAQGRAQTVGPAAFLEDDVVVEAAKAKALVELQRRIAERVKRLREPS